MKIMEMLGQSGVLTVFGMGVVFSFLIIMILSITIVGKLINALKLNKELMTQALAAAPSASIASGNTVTAAISAAVKEYRKLNK